MASREQRQEAIRHAAAMVRAGHANMLLRAVSSTASVPDVGPLVTVQGVEIVQTGIEYPLASGPHTFTVEDLADAVEAAEHDPAIKAPRLRLGHEGLQDPEWDGEPAIGIVSNMRLEQSGHTIVGDYENIPEWLAVALPSAYPGRSIDGEVGVVTNTGHSWGLVITGLALLGVRWPGVSTLDDIKALYGTEMPDNVRIYSTEEVDDVTVAAAGTPVQGRMDVDTIRRQYYNSLEGAESWNMWIRGQYQDPDELIVEDESSGDLYRIPYTISGQEVEFGDKVAVIEDFIDKPKAPDKAAAVAAAMFGINLIRKPVAVYATRDESRKDIVVAGAAATAIGPAELRALVGLGDDATEEALTEALAAAGIIWTPGGEGDKAPGAEQPGTTASGSSASPAPQPNVTGPSGGDKNDPAVASPTQSAPVAGVRTVDEATFQQLMADAAAGRTALTRLTNGDRDAAVSAAIKAGKIPKSRETYWQGMWDRDPEGTKTLLTAAADKGGLAPGLIPVDNAELGGVTPEGGDLNTDDAYPAEWLPEVAARKQQQAAQLAAQQGGLYPPHPNAHLMRRGL